MRRSHKPTLKTRNQRRRNKHDAIPKTNQKPNPNQSRIQTQQRIPHLDLVLETSHELQSDPSQTKFIPSLQHPILIETMVLGGGEGRCGSCCCRWENDREIRNAEGEE